MCQTLFRELGLSREQNTQECLPYILAGRHRKQNKKLNRQHIDDRQDYGIQELKEEG